MASYLSRANVLGFLLASFFAVSAAKACPKISLGFHKKKSSAAVEKSVARMAQGTPIELCLADETKVRGRLRQISDGSLTLNIIRGATVSSRSIKLADVESVKKLSGRSKLAAGIAGIAGLAIGLGAFVFAIVLLV